MSQPRNEGIAGVTFSSAGHELVGIAYLARGDHAKPTVLLLHGCPGIDHHGDLAAELRDHGWNTLMFHYRGCWGSQGPYNLTTITADISAAVDYLSAARLPGIDPARLAVVGHSMGGWAAIQAAARDERLKASVSIAAPAKLDRLLTLPDSAIEREFTRFLAATPAELRHQLVQAAAQPGPLDLISAVSPRPVLIVHGSADEWVPATDGLLLHERAGEPREYAEIDGANHAFSWHRAELRQLVVTWLAKSGL